MFEMVNAGSRQCFRAFRAVAVMEVFVFYFGLFMVLHVTEIWIFLAKKEIWMLMYMYMFKWLTMY